MTKLPKVLTDDELDALIGVFNTRYDSGLRNLCAVRLMAECGLRAGELTGLRVDDVNLMSGQIDVRDGKGGKDRTLWCSEELTNLIREWRGRRASSEWLFPTRTGARWGVNSLRRTVKRYADKAGINWNVTPHTLRHTFATRLLRATSNIRLVQKALGHADLSTTMIYTHIVDDELEAAMKAVA